MSKLHKILVTINNRTQFIASRVLIALIIGLRPLLGPACCRFPVTCTQFAVIKLKEEPLCKALWEIIKRLARCQPFF